MLRQRAFVHVPGPAQRAPRPFSSVDIAGPSDLEDLVWFLRSMRAEIEGGEIDEDLLIAYATQMIYKNGGLALIVRGSREIEASLGMLFERPRLSRSYRLTVLWNVVAPSKRTTTGHAKSLLREAALTAQKIGRPLLLEQHGPVDAPKARLCSRHLKTAGVIFLSSPSDITAEAS